MEVKSKLISDLQSLFAIPALGIVADTGPWLMPVQYERIARAAGNALDKVLSGIRWLNDVGAGRCYLELVEGRAQRPCPLCFDRLSMTPVFNYVMLRTKHLLRPV